MLDVLFKLSVLIDTLKHAGDKKGYNETIVQNGLTRNKLIVQIGFFNYYESFTLMYLAQIDEKINF